MKTLLILGSKPEPVLPPPGSYQAVACANGSGHSAAARGLPRPVFTVMTPLIACDIDSGRQTLEALRGLSTGTVYLLRSRREGPRGLARLVYLLRTVRRKSILRTHPRNVGRKLRSVSYLHDRLIPIRPDEYDTLVERLCDHEPGTIAQLRRKPTSTGVTGLAIAIDQERYDRYILSGFSFELTHSYAVNPVIRRRGTRVSSHAETDARVIACLARRMGNIFTTEDAVHERANVPFLPGWIG